MPLDEYLSKKIPLLSREHSLKLTRTVLFNSISFVVGFGMGAVTGNVIKATANFITNADASLYSREQQILHALLMTSGLVAPLKVKVGIPFSTLMEFVPGYAYGVYLGSGASNYLIK